MCSFDPKRKNILLINPWIYDFTAYDFWLKPLGLLYIASILRRQTSCRLHFIDCLDRFHPLLEKKPKSKIDGRGHFPKEEVQKPEVLKNVPRKYSRYGIPLELFLHELDQAPVPDLVLITCTMTYWYPGVQAVVELIRQKLGSVPVVLGGIYATLATEHAIRLSGADVVIPGPGENKILPILKQILGDADVREAEFRTFKDLPRPAYDLLPTKGWLPLLTSRGCPFRCTFCAGPLLYDRFEQGHPSETAADIGRLFQHFGTRHFSFYDDALLLNKESHIIPILEEVVRRGWPVSFHTPNGLHIREIDQDLAFLMKKAGVRSLYLSQESFDEGVIREACPKVAEGDLEKAVACLEKAGYRREDINVYLIAGLPNQEVAGIKESILHVGRLGAKVRLAYFSPIPGTPIWRELVDNGVLKKDADPLIYNKLAFPYLWGDFSSGDFESLRKILDS
jgi:radical SAM superfamily enzyme YgiQ (UPF0313 family)